MYQADEKRYEEMKYNRCGASGLQLPAVSLGLWHNFGSNGNFDNMQDMCHTAFDHGITVSLPVITYAEAWKKSHDETLRALIVSNLVSIYIKHYIGPLSAFCGAVSASTGAGAAITFMATNGDARKMAMTVTNTLANVGGIL